MRISRKKRPKKSLIPHFQVNHKIDAEEVRLLDADGNNAGVLSTRDALDKARNEGMDLILINPKAKPPVAKISDFTHFKYQKEKEARKQKANVHVQEIKGIRLSMRIGKGDLETRKNQATKFLERGDKVKLEIILRGAERYKTPLAYDVINIFRKELDDEIGIKVEQEPTRQGNKITAILAKK